MYCAHDPNNTDRIASSQYKKYRAKNQYCGYSSQIMASSHRRLRFERKNSGYKTAAEFATKNYFPVGTYRSHENGTRRLTPRAAKKYAAIFGIPYIELLEDTLSENAKETLPFPIIKKEEDILLQKCATAIERAAKSLNKEISLSQAMALTVQLYKHIRDYREKGSMAEPSEEMAALLLKN